MSFFRLALRPLVRVQPPLQRQFSSTIRRCILGVPTTPSQESLLPLLKESKFFRDLEGNGPVLQRMLEFQNVLQAEGFELTKPPGTMAMIKLMANKNVRSAALAMNEELTKAGVDMQAAIAEFAEIAKKAKGAHQ